MFKPPVRWFNSWLSSLLLCTLSWGAVAETVQDLRYGVTLYHFFQGDYFNALTELTAAQALSTDPESPLRLHHEQSASLLRGGMSLSYGLDRAAEASFQQWLSASPVEESSAWTKFLTRKESSAWQKQHQRAWFYLGKLNYQRGDRQRALAALQQSQAASVQPGRRPGSVSKADVLSQESLYLQAKLYLQEGELEQASALMNQLPKSAIYWPYYWFNRGSQQAAAGDWAAAAASYLQLQTLSLTDEVDKTLRDRALTAAGFALLQIDDIPTAIQAFSAVRLDSLTSDRALLGLGWAQLQRGEPEQALAPWQALRSQSLLQSSVQEVYLALPYAYEQLQADAAALREYEFARNALSQEIDQLDIALRSYLDEPLEQLFGLDVTAGSDWLIAEEIQPLGDSAYYLSHLLARHDFQAAVKDYRDLINLRGYLQKADERLQVLQLVDNEQQALWQRVIDSGANEGHQQQYQQLQQAVVQLDQRIADAKADLSGRQLGDKKRLELWGLIERSQENFQSLDAVGQVTEFEADQLRRFRGLLLWEDSEQYAAALWDLQKQRKELAAVMEQSEQGLTTLQQTITQRQQPQASLRIQTLMARTQVQQRQVQEQLAVQEQAIRTLATEELQKQQLRLNAYLGRTQLSIARLYDKYSEDTGNAGGVGQ